MLTGVVWSSSDCRPIAGATLELWPEETGKGHPDPKRATLTTDQQGHYSYECNPPEHIHMRISAPGYRTIGVNSYHPDGKATGTFDIVLEPTASQPQTTPIAIQPPAQVAFSGSVIFQNTAAGSVEAIDSSGVHHVLADPTVAERVLPWAASPDGKQLAVVVLSGVSEWLMFERAALWVVDVDEHNPRKLLDLISPATDQNRVTLTDRSLAIGNTGFQHVLWNAVDNSIIVTSAHEGNVDLYAIKADGSGIQRLTDTPDYEYGAALAPDGYSLAYASANTFGTGAGFGKPAAWRMQLSDRQPINISAEGDFMAAILGWSDTTHVVVATQQAGKTHYIVSDSQSIMHIAAATNSMASMRHGQLFYTEHADAQHSVVYHWNGTDSKPVPITVQADELNPAPDGQAFVACSGAQRQYWHAGALMEIAAGSCNELSWSPRGDLALNSPSDAGVIVGPSGGLHEAAIHPKARFAGWDDMLLYYFAPTGPNQWQLYRCDITTTDQAIAIGQPITGIPQDPMFVKIR